MLADQDLEQPMRDQLVQRQQLLVGLDDGIDVCQIRGAPPAFSACVASLMTESDIASPAISHSEMKRSTAVGKLTANTP